MEVPAILDEGEYLRWITTAKRNVESSRRDAGGGDYNWSCFKAHQAGEMAVKALLHGLGLSAYGHSVSRLLTMLEGRVEVPRDVMSCAKSLDKLYVPTRYPNAWAEGLPHEYYIEEDAERAIACAERIVSWVEETWTSLRRGR
ncbi:MAG: HEPN domain-containing protein [Candidatus Nezhaarchaeota archaeon]|nr:HEPN domain-containing protein [Candidatus Nezhaarchaeota archaeon]